jgi:hypothetical protein
MSDYAAKWIAGKHGACTWQYAAVAWATPWPCFAQPCDASCLPLSVCGTRRKQHALGQIVRFHQFACSVRSRTTPTACRSSQVDASGSSSELNRLCAAHSFRDSRGTVQHAFFTKEGAQYVHKSRQSTFAREQSYKQLSFVNSGMTGIQPRTCRHGEGALDNCMPLLCVRQSSLRCQGWCTTKGGDVVRRSFASAASYACDHLSAESSEGALQPGDLDAARALHCTSLIAAQSMEAACPSAAMQSDIQGTSISTGASSELTEAAIGNSEVVSQHVEVITESSSVASQLSQCTPIAAEQVKAPPLLPSFAYGAPPKLEAIVAVSPQRIECNEAARPALTMLKACRYIGLSIVRLRDQSGLDSIQASAERQSGQASQDAMEGLYLLLHNAKRAKRGTGTPQQEDVFVFDFKSWAQGLVSQDGVATQLASILTASHPLKVGGSAVLVNLLASS